jgi:hypothetical protein
MRLREPSTGAAAGVHEAISEQAQKSAIDRNLQSAWGQCGMGNPLRMPFLGFLRLVAMKTEIEED